MNETGIVIARYHEDLKWVEEIKGAYDLYIYNRHENNAVNTGSFNPKVLEKNGVNLILINMDDDTGYEASVYAHHCLTKYDSLNDFTVFLQGDAPRHSKMIIPILNEPKRLLYTHYTAYGASDGCVPPTARRTGEPIEFEYLTDSWAWGHIIETDKCWYMWKDDFSKRPTQEFAPCRTLPDGSLEICGKAVGFGMWRNGANFVVSKKRILRHPPEFYQRLKDFAINYIDEYPTPDWRWGCEPVRKYYGEVLLESIWEYIF